MQECSKKATEIHVQCPIGAQCYTDSAVSTTVAQNHSQLDV